MVGLRRMLVAVCSAVLLCCACAHAASARSPKRAKPVTPKPTTLQDLQPTPAMGADSGNASGCAVSAASIEATARAMHTDGMQADGYRYVDIDDCWMAPQRTAAGRLQAKPSQFPQGIAPVAAYVHGLGLKLGIVADAGTETCDGGPGSLGHETLDARTFASWGVDEVTYEQCDIPFANDPGLTHQQVDTTLYTRMSAALRRTGYPIVFAMANGVDPAADPWRWGGAIANSWTTTGASEDSFVSTLANFTGDVSLSRYARPGRFNDPDMLEIGNGGQSTTQYETQFSLWAELAAPLIADTSLTTLTRADRLIYENRAVIAVDQDPLGRQAVPIADDDGLWVLSKTLAGGQHAVALFNATGEPQTISTTAAQIGATPAPAYRLQDLWSGRVTRTTSAISAYVPADGTTMLRVSSLPTGADTRTRAPATTLALSAPAGPFTPGETVPLTVTLSDQDSHALSAATVTVTPPVGWSPASTPITLGAVPAGGHVQQTIELTAPGATVPLSAVPVLATARYRHAGPGAADTISASQPLQLLSPVTAPDTTADTTGETATVGKLGGAFSVQGAGGGIAPAEITATGTTAASDAYAAVVQPAAATTQSTAEVTVTAQTGSPLAPVGQAGLIERPSLTVPGGPEGVVLDVTTSGQVQMRWDATGGTVVDSTVTAPLTVALPVTLQLVRAGTTFTGLYSHDGGVTWTGVGQVTVAAGAAPATEDVGAFHSSGTAGWDTDADFSGFVVAPTGS
jgi:alpha-galactosidase